MSNDEILAIFFQECEEALGVAEAGLIACRDGRAGSDTVNAIFRSVHSIKGGAGAFGFTGLQAFTHKFETVLALVRDGVLPLSGDLTALLLRASDMLSDHVGAVRGETGPPDDALIAVELEAASSRLDTDALSSSTVQAADDEDQRDWSVLIRPRAGAMDNGGDPLPLLRELERLGGTCVAVDDGPMPDLCDFDAAEAYIGFHFRVPGDIDADDIRDIFDFVGDDCRLDIVRGDGRGAFAAMMGVAPVHCADDAAHMDMAPPARNSAADAMLAVPGKSEAAAPPARTIRVDLTRLDSLIDMVGELVIAQAMMAQRLADHGLEKIDELGMLDQLTRDLQDGAMAIRAQPIGSVFSRVPRIVRELEAETGKRVRLDMAGEHTELDRTVVERLGEPLTHLIRNAIDHGIESAEARIAAGKPAEGVVRLSAEQRSGKVFITIADDGAGIDRDRVFAKAAEKGLVAADARLSEEEIDALIFAPGFSTATRVSNISGRGVGMDVVRQNVKDLGGRITIVSTPGRGCVFTLVLPLTLAIADGMIVAVGDQRMVIPLTHVVECLQPLRSDLRPTGNGRYLLDVRGTFLPILPLAEHIGASGAVERPEDAVLIVVETEDGGPAIVMVDGIVDQRQFVIKSLEANFQAVSCVAGATILGDGKVALILDIETLVRSALRRPGGDSAKLAA